MVVLCASCHGLYDREKKIPEAAIRAYKRNLATLSGRYSDYERRILEMYVMTPEEKLNGHMELPGSMDFMLYYLVHDDIITLHHAGPGFTPNRTGNVAVQLTDSGLELIKRMRLGKALA